MNALRLKFVDDTKDFQQHTKAFIESLFGQFTQGIESKVVGNELMLNSGTTETANTIAILRKNVTELQNQLAQNLTLMQTFNRQQQVTEKKGVKVEKALQAVITTTIETKKMQQTIIPTVSQALINGISDTINC